MSGTSPTEPVAGPEPPAPRGWARQTAMVVVLGGVALAGWLTASDGYVRGGLALSGVCAVAALLRLVLPTTWVGTLAVRRPLLDALVLAAMALAVAVLTLSVPLPRP